MGKHGKTWGKHGTLPLFNQFFIRRKIKEGRGRLRKLEDLSALPLNRAGCHALYYCLYFGMYEKKMGERGNHEMGESAGFLPLCGSSSTQKRLFISMGSEICGHTFGRRFHGFLALFPVGGADITMLFGKLQGMENP